MAALTLITRLIVLASSLYRVVSLEFFQIHLKLFGSLINASELIDSLDALGRNAQPDVAVQVFRKEPLPLQVNILNLVDALVGEGHDTSLAVG